jgi:plastocyanin
VGIVLAAIALLVGGLVPASGVSAAGSDILTAKLSGAHEVGPVATGGTGRARVVIQAGGASIFYQVFFSGLSGPVVAAHIHVGAIGENGPIILPLNLSGSTGSGILTAADLTGAKGLTFAQAVDAIRTGGAYINLHTAAHPGGEIRGQLYDGSGPQSYVIAADAPEAVPAGHLWAYNDYFPRSLTVAQGSTISFAIKGFHTGTLLPAGMTAHQDNTGANAAFVDDTDDTARNPNGTTPVVFNVPALLPALPTSTCGSAAEPCRFDGTQIVGEGAPLGPPTDPTQIRIDAPSGTYIFHCRVHPQMTGSLTVVSPGSTAAASPDDLASASAAQVAADTASATATEKAKNKAATHFNRDGSITVVVNLGAETPDHRVALLEMLPAKIAIAPGDHVLWRASGRNEPHTVTFPKDLGTDTVPICEGPNGTDIPCQGPPDELLLAPGNGVSTLTSPTTVSDSGLVYPPIAAVEGFGTRPSAALDRWRVDVAPNAALGTYTYVCQIHDGMTGTVDVKLMLPDRDPSF